MKVYAHTLGFCSSRVLKVGMEDFYATATPGIFEAHYFLDQHYPLRREQNVGELHEICDRYGMTWVDSGHDRGLVDGFNYLYGEAVQPEGDALLCGFDPDSQADTPGWNKAMVEVLQAEPMLAWVSLGETRVLENIRQSRLQGAVMRVAGHRVFLPDRIDMIGVTCVRWSFIKAMGGLQGAFKYYGQVEIPLHQAMQAHGMRYAYLMDYTEHWWNDGHDQPYVDWKSAHIEGYPGRFEDWLRDKGIAG